MTVKTGKVTGRRELHFQTIDDIIADAEQMAAVPVKTLGNWSAGRIFKHLGIAFDLAVKGSTFKPPLFIRLLAPLFKKRFLTKPMSPGFQMPKAMQPDFMPPDDVSTEEGLAALRSGFETYKNATTLAPSAALGRLTRAEYDQLQMRHAEMHLSFLLPE